MVWKIRLVATLGITTLVALALAALLVRPSIGLSTRQAFFELDDPHALSTRKSEIDSGNR